MFQVQRKLKVAEAFLNLMGYFRLQGSSDLILHKLSQQDLYSIVADIVILHEDLKIILFLLDRVSKWSRVPTEFRHVMLARKLGPPMKQPCLDFIMSGHVVSSDHSQISEQRPLTPSSKNYDILGLQLDDSPSSSFELPPPIMTQSQLQYMMRGRESSYPYNNSPFDREEVILPTLTKSGSYPNTVLLPERENSFEKTPFTASMLRRHSDSSGSSGTSWGQTSFTRNLYQPFKQSDSSPMFKIGVEDTPYNERTSLPLSRQGRTPLLQKGLSVGSSMSDSAYYSTQPSSQYPSNQFATYQYDGQYNQHTNQYGSQYDSRYSNQYDSHYGNQLSNTCNYPLNSRDNLTLKQNKEPTIRKYVNVDIDEVVQEATKGIALQFNSSSQSTHHGLLKVHSIDSLLDMQAHGTLDSSPPQSTNNQFHVQQRSHSASSLMEPAIQYPSGHHTVSSLPRPSTPALYKISPRPSTTCKGSLYLTSKVGAQHWTCYYCMNENYNNTNICDGCYEIYGVELTKQEREFENEKTKLQEKNVQLQTLIDSLQFEKKSLKKENEHLKIQKHSFEIQIQQLDKEKQHLQREVTDLQASYTQLQREKDQSESELQHWVNCLTVENMRLKEQLDYSSWKVSHEEVTLTKEKLGKGAWGAIWIGIFREQRVAVKQMHELIINEDTLQLLHREINTMAQLRHPNLLQFIGAVLDDPSGNPMIITEIMDTSLCNAYETKQLIPDPSCEPVMLTIIRDVAVGLNYLHCLPDPIIHRDVSSANVLLESKDPNKWKTKISDFGSANKARKAKTRGAGALVYGAPESVPSLVKVQKAQTTKMDVFSYGVLLCEVMTCCFPADLPIFQEMLQQVRSRSPSLHDLIVSCIKEDPSSRPIMKQVIERLDIYRQNTSIQSDQTN